MSDESRFVPGQKCPHHCDPHKNRCGEQYRIFTRLNAAAFIKFLAFPMRRLFKGGVYFKIIFLKSLIIITVNHS